MSAAPGLRAPRALRLQDLATLKRHLEETAHAQTLALTAQREREAAVRRERELFALTVGPVVPLKPSLRAQMDRPRAAPEPLQRLPSAPPSRDTRSCWEDYTRQGPQRASWRRCRARFVTS